MVEAIEAIEAVEAPHPVFKQFATESHSLELVNDPTGWCPPSYKLVYKPH